MEVLKNDQKIILPFFTKKHTAPMFPPLEQIRLC